MLAKLGTVGICMCRKGKQYVLSCRKESPGSSRMGARSVNGVYFCSRGRDQAERTYCVILRVEIMPASV